MKAAPLYDDLAEGPEGGSAWWLTARDGVRVRAGCWPGGDNGTVLLFPGRTEYIEKYGRTAGDLARRGYGTLTIDWRGQGLAHRVAADAMRGHVGKFSDYQLDVAAMLGLAEALELPRPWYLLAHSMGGCIGLRALLQGLPVAASAFSAPMWGLAMAPHKRPMAWVLSFLSRYIGIDQRLAPGTIAESFVAVTSFAENTLTGDADMYAYMQRHVAEKPEFGLGGPSLGWLYEALVETRALQRMAAPVHPAVTYLGTLEEVVDPVPVHLIMDKWASGSLTMVEGARHEFPMEQPQIRDQFLDAAQALFSENAQIS